MSSAPCSCFTIEGNQTLIISFGGLGLQFGQIPPFEFLKTLQQIVPQYTKHFYIDIHRAWYHHGIDGISTDIETTQLYLSNIIKSYDKVIFIGTSAGGYAAILFGSLLNVDKVIAFIPQTVLERDHSPYANLNSFINSTTSYYVFGDPNAIDPTDLHCYSHCMNLAQHPNVEIIPKRNLNLPTMRDTGELQTILKTLL